MKCKCSLWCYLPCSISVQRKKRKGYSFLLSMILSELDLHQGKSLLNYVMKSFYMDCRVCTIIYVEIIDLGLYLSHIPMRWSSSWKVTSCRSFGSLNLIEAPSIEVSLPLSTSKEAYCGPCSLLLGVGVGGAIRWESMRMPFQKSPWENQMYFQYHGSRHLSLISA